MAAAFAAAFVVASSIAWWTAGVVAAVVVVEYETLPCYARARSLRPARHLLTGGGAVLLLAVATGALAPRELRASLLVVGASAIVMLASAGLKRVFRRPRSALLVGDRDGVTHLVRQWSARPEIDVRGVCLPQASNAETTKDVLGAPVRGSLSDVTRLAVELGVDTVVTAPGPALSAYDVRRLGWALEGTNTELMVASEIHGAHPHRVTAEVLGRRLLFSVRPGRRSTAGELVKNLIDRTGAAALLVLFAPVLAALAVLVRMDSPGAAFFVQERAGQGGRRFNMVKFRTMCVDAESLLEQLREQNEAEGPMFKIRQDPRVTRLGRILRKTSMDELPQLFNVLTGDMSLIGPRPCLPSEADLYDDWVRHRLAVKPGMTGAWQVGGRSNLGWQDSVRMDIDYVDNWTLRNDLAIAARTASAVIRREGAS